MIKYVEYYSGIHPKWKVIYLLWLKSNLNNLYKYDRPWLEIDISFVNKHSGKANET